MRHCADINMFAIDRARVSCKHATDYCRAKCYNIKLYQVFGHVMTPHDATLETDWSELTGEKLAKMLSRKKHSTARVRLMTRGEAFATEADVVKVADLLTNNPDTLFWIPTRAWRDYGLRQTIDALIRVLPNARVLASIDPSNTTQELEYVDQIGWSTAFFGSDDVHPAGDKAFKCPKTWEKKVHCHECVDGCFSTETKHVWLKSH